MKTRLSKDIENYLTKLVRTGSSGGSYEYPQFMTFWQNIINNVYHCKPQFYYIKVGFYGVKIM